VPGGDTPLCQTDRIEAFIDHAKRCRLCHAHQLPVSSLVRDADDKLFESVPTNLGHTLNKLLPDHRPELPYTLQPSTLSGMISC